MQILFIKGTEAGGSLAGIAAETAQRDSIDTVAPLSPTPPHLCQLQFELPTPHLTCVCVLAALLWNIL